MQQSVRFDILMVPVIVLVSLAALAIAIVVLRMLFSQRYRLVGVGLLTLGCLGAMLVAGMLLMYRARSVARHQLMRAEMRQMEMMAQAEAHQAALMASQDLSNAVPPLESAIRRELEESSAEVEQGTSFEALESLETETIEPNDDVPEIETPTSVNSEDTESPPSAEDQDASVDSDQDPFAVPPIVAPSKTTNEPAKPWLVEIDEFEFEGFPAKVVSSHPAPDVTTCVEDLATKLANECDGYVRSYTPWKIDVTPELIACAVRDEHVESVGGSQKVVHKLLVFDRDFKQQAEIEINHARMTSRLGATGIAAGVVLSSLTGLFGILSFTHRRRERRLS